MKTKTLVTLLLTIVMILSLASCNKNQLSEQPTETENDIPETSNQSVSPTDIDDTSSITPLPTDTDDSTETADDSILYSGREMYEEIIYAFIEADDELSRGWFDKDAQNLVRLIKGDTISSDASVTDLLKVYRGFDDIIEFTDYCIRDFFTVTNSYESTNGGVYNFFEAINQLEDEKLNNCDVIKTNSNGNVIGFDFDIAGGDKAIAQALGVSEEFVNIMIHAASDAGFNVTFD
ncbi:MAG: hypothetical protein IKT70_02300 [Clostridia bacterium]|nr:hypothetical protein [Clostridia bacterium]